MHLPYAIWVSAKLEISESKINQKTTDNKRERASIEIRNAYRVRTVQSELDEIAFGRVYSPGFPWPVEGFARNQHLDTLHQPESRENASMLRLAHGRLLGIIAAALGALLRVILRQLEN